MWPNGGSLHKLKSVSKKASKMATVSEELQSFYQFVEVRLQGGDKSDSLDDLYAEWRAYNQTPEEFGKNVQAVRASLRDLDKGETGRAVGAFAAEFRQRNGI